jgi:ABC-2 type transport system ATP-binding protein
MRALVRRLAQEGITILLSSHLLNEVEELCNRVAIIQRGAILYEGRLRELLADAGVRHRLRTTDDERARLLAAQRGLEARVDGEELVLAAGEPELVELTLALGAAGIGIRALVPEQATLEQLFFRLTEGAGEPAAVGDEEPALEVA